MEYADVVGRIRAGEIAPVYLLFGPQTFMIEAVLEGLRAAVGVEKHGSFACETFHGDEDNGTKIAAAAREIPMLVPRRLLVVRDAQHLAARDEDIDVLVAYLDRPSPTTVLAFTAAAFDARTRLARKVAEVGVLLKAEKVYARDLPSFVHNHARALGAALAEDAAAALLDACGDDLAALHDGISKLALYVERGQPATVEDVQAVVAPSRQHAVFELIDAIGARDAPQAFELVARMAEQGEAPLKVLSLVARQIRQLIDIRTGRRDSPRLLGLHPFVRGKLEDQAKRFGLRDLVRGVAALHHADLALKGSKREGERVLESLVLEIAGGPERPTSRRPGRRGG
ncbi:MAG: DNA polymerase III subunit delta [Deltaproteobacteria bacterium]|nr:DNA polymerase III subunit delta [Deltaproteobacteria bacterium]